MFGIGEPIYPRKSAQASQPEAILYDIFSGTTGANITGRTPDVVQPGGTENWILTPIAGRKTGVINANRWASDGTAANFGNNIDLLIGTGWTLTTDVTPGSVNNPVTIFTNYIDSTNFYYWSWQNSNWYIAERISGTNFTRDTAAQGLGTGVIYLVRSGAGVLTTYDDSKVEVSTYTSAVDYTSDSDIGLNCYADASITFYDYVKVWNTTDVNNAIVE